MPYFNFSQESFEELSELSAEVDFDLNQDQYQRDAEGDVYTYEAAHGQFTPDQLEGPARQVYQVLQDLGVVTVRCRYDGGGDEGFAHFDEAILHNQSVKVESLATQLSTGPLGEVPPDSPLAPADYFESLSRVERAQAALDWFAFALATRLLGEGYGTGDYSMYGVFQADLSTGQLIDEPVSDTQG